MTTYSSYAMIVVFFLIAVLTHWMSHWQKRTTTFFGVSVADGFGNTDEGRTILQRFRRRLWQAAAMMSVLVVLPHGNTHTKLLPLLPLFFPLIVAYEVSRAWRETRVYAASPARVREVDLSTEPLPPSRISIVCFSIALLPLFIVPMLALLMYAHWDQVPQQIAVGWNSAGAPTEWIVRGWKETAGRFLSAELLGILGAVVAFGFTFRTRFSDWGTDAKKSERYRLLLMSWPLLTQLCIMPMLMIEVLAPLAGTVLPGTPSGWFHAVHLTSRLVLIPLLGMLIVTYLVRPPNLVDSTPDTCWKWGQFYINRDDPAYIVPRRFGAGYTLNLGRPGVWLSIVCAMLSFAPIILLR